MDEDVSNPTIAAVAVTTAVEGVTVTNPTTVVEDAMTAEAVETASAPKDTEATDSDLATGIVRSATT